MNPESTNIDLESAECRAVSNNFVTSSANFELDQTWPEFGQMWPNFRESWPRNSCFLIVFDHIWPELGQIWAANAYSICLVAGHEGLP